MKIAILEDSNTGVALWQNMLQGAEYTIGYFDTRSETIARVGDFAPDLIISPGVPRHVGAKDLLLAIKGHPVTRRAALAVATSLNNENMNETWDVELIDQILLKPLTREQVMGFLEEARTRLIGEKRKTPLAIVVDDGNIARSVLTNEMETLGFRVETAQDGEEGIELIKRRLPNIAIVDIEMPRKNGIEVCEALAASPATSQLPIIVVSATVNDRIMRGGFHSGAITFLPKPVETSELSRTIESVMGQRSFRRRHRALVLEDSPTVASILSRILGEMGVTSTICKTVESLRTHVSISIPDLITLDLTLPDGSGLELCQSLRGMKELDGVPIVVISAASHRETMVKALNLGANDFLEKPFIKDEFKARIRNLLKVKSLKDELAQKVRVLDNLAYHDGLTGLFNRRFLEEEITQETERSRNQNSPLGFMMIDLDLFKKVNDSYGHEVGDSVLREVADIIKSNIRSYDIPCRYGGEELCVLLPGISLAHSVTIAERIRLACEKNRYLTEGIEQTVSIGVSAFPAPSAANRLVADADDALYKAKENGRNQVVSVT